MLHLQPAFNGVMRSIITVQDLLNLFPVRKKSWAYNNLQSIRDSTGKKVVTVRDVAEYFGFTEEEVRSGMIQRG